jgi:hypothetical protein
MAFFLEADRPFLVFERTLNKGITDRPVRTGKDGKPKGGRLGEHKQIWHKTLVDRITGSPFVWARPEWIIRKLSPTCRLIGIGNFDKIPSTYPARWRGQLMECYQVAQPQVSANEEHAKLIGELEQLKNERKATGATTQKGNRRPGEEVPATSGS